MTRFFISFILFLYLAFSNLWAQSPFSEITYSARLSGISGASLAGSAVVSMSIGLYETEIGGNPEYIQFFSAIEVTNGFFSLPIGPALPDLKQFPFLELEVQGQLLSPRRKFLTMPYSVEAMDSERLGGSTPEEFRQNILTGMGVTDGATSGILAVETIQAGTVVSSGTMESSTLLVQNLIHSENLISTSIRADKISLKKGIALHPSFAEGSDNESLLSTAVFSVNSSGSLTAQTIKAVHIYGSKVSANTFYGDGSNLSGILKSDGVISLNDGVEIIPRGTGGVIIYNSAGDSNETTRIVLRTEAGEDLFRLESGGRLLSQTMGAKELFAKKISALQLHIATSPEAAETVLSVTNGEVHLDFLDAGEVNIATTLEVGPSGDFYVGSSGEVTATTISAGQFIGDGTGITGVLHDGEDFSAGNFTVSTLSGGILSVQEVNANTLAASFLIGDGSGITGVLHDGEDYSAGHLTISTLTDGIAQLSGGILSANEVSANTLAATYLIGDGAGITGVLHDGEDYSAGHLTVSTLTDGIAQLSGGIISANEVSANTLAATYLIGDGSGITGVLHDGEDYSAGTLTVSTLTDGSVVLSGGILSANELSANTVAATYLIGDGSAITGVLHDGEDYSAGTLTISTLTDGIAQLSGGILSANEVSATTVAASYLLGDGSNLTNLPTPSAIFSGRTTIEIDTTTPGTQEHIHIYTDGVQTMFITSNGVGIGVSFPQQALEVSGNVSATAYFGDGSNLSGIDSAGVTVGLTGALFEQVYLSRDSANQLYGTSANTHINLGFGSNTGASGQNFKHSAVLSGESHTAAEDYAVVAGGFSNTANGHKSFVGGGLFNQANGDYSAVLGGQYNRSMGFNSSVIGGSRLRIGGDGSLGFRGGIHGSHIQRDADQTVYLMQTALCVGEDDTSCSASSYTSGVIYSTAVTATGNITAAAFFGDGSSLTGIDSAGVTVGSTGALFDEVYISRDADNELNGNMANTHVNLGIQSQTGAEGSNNFYVTVGGGYKNEASGNYSSVSGGFLVTASGFGSTAGGGFSNISSGSYASVAGGVSNTASGGNSTVSGGQNNEAAGVNSVISGGRSLKLTGTGSMGFRGGDNSTQVTLNASDTVFFLETALCIGEESGDCADSSFTTGTANIRGPQVSIVNSGEARYHLYNIGANAEWIMGQKTNSDHDFKLSKVVSGTEYDYVTVDTSGNMSVGTTGDFGKFTVDGDMISIYRAAAAGEARYHLYNGGAMAGWVLGQPSSTDHGFTISKDVANVKTDYFHISESSGNVGIGTTSPTQILDVRSSTPILLVSSTTNQSEIYIDAPSSTYTAVRFNSGSSTKWSLQNRGGFDTPNDRFSLWESSSERLTILNGGKVGIGTNNPNTDLEIKNSSTHAEFRINSSAANTVAGMTFYNGDTVKWYFQSRGTLDSGPATDRLSFYNSSANEKFTFTQDGRLGIESSNPLHPIHLLSGAHVTSGGVWTDASSRDFKENIRDLSEKEALETLEALEPKSYNYKVDREEQHLGFIAEEVPEMVATKDRKGMSPMDIAAILTKVGQKHQRELEKKDQEIKDLKKLHDVQELRMQALEEKLEFLLQSQD